MQHPHTVSCLHQRGLQLAVRAARQRRRVPPGRSARRPPLVASASIQPPKQQPAKEVPRLAVFVSGGGSNMRAIHAACQDGRINAVVAVSGQGVHPYRASQAPLLMHCSPLGSPSGARAPCTSLPMPRTRTPAGRGQRRPHLRGRGVRAAARHPRADSPAAQVRRPGGRADQRAAGGGADSPAQSRLRAAGGVP